jgi:hypothetical protein
MAVAVKTFVGPSPGNMLIITPLVAVDYTIVRES